MFKRKSNVIYGIKIYSEIGCMDYDVASDICNIANNHEDVEALWVGIEGEPRIIVLGIMLQDYDINSNTANLKELLEKEEQAKKIFPVDQILEEIKQYLEEEGFEEELEDINYKEKPETIIIVNRE